DEARKSCDHRRLRAVRSDPYRARQRRARLHLRPADRFELGGLRPRGARLRLALYRLIRRIGWPRLGVLHRCRRTEAGVDPCPHRTWVDEQAWTPARRARGRRAALQGVPRATRVIERHPARRCRCRIMKLSLALGLALGLALVLALGAYFGFAEIAS